MRYAYIVCKSDVMGYGYDAMVDLRERIAYLNVPWWLPECELSSNTPKRPEDIMVELQNRRNTEKEGPYKVIHFDVH